MSELEKYEREFATYVTHLTSLWLTYLDHPTKRGLHDFRDAQSTLYLAQALGLEGNYLTGHSLLRLPLAPPNGCPRPLY